MFCSIDSLFTTKRRVLCVRGPDPHESCVYIVDDTADAAAMTIVSDGSDGWISLLGYHFPVLHLEGMFVALNAFHDINQS